jgi:hypothetical protein
VIDDLWGFLQGHCVGRIGALLRQQPCENAADVRAGESLLTENLIEVGEELNNLLARHPHRSRGMIAP